jgi:hypothetical protein
MKDSQKMKDFRLDDVIQERKTLHIKIKAIRALSFVFDVIIFMIAILYIYDIDFIYLLMIPALVSLFIHSYLYSQINKISLLAQQEVILKYLKK